MTRMVTSENVSGKEDAGEKKKVKETPSTKVVIRCLPPTLTEADFLEQISPLPDNNYFSYVEADRSLEANAFCRAYINAINQEDILPFRDQWDGYPFTDTKGTEYPAVVEFAPYQKVPKKQGRKSDLRCGTIENDDDFKAFKESLQAEVERLPSAETYLEELEAKLNEKEAQELTPLLAFLKNKKMERIKIRQEAREERRRKEREQKKRDEERRQKREEERRQQREKQRHKEREAKEKEKGKVKKENGKDKSQKIKLLTKPEGGKRKPAEDSLAPLDEKNKGKEKPGRKDQARQDDRKVKDSKSNKSERYQVLSGGRSRDSRDKTSQLKELGKEQEGKERKWEKEQQIDKEGKNKDRDRQQGERVGEKLPDRDHDKPHDGDEGGKKDIRQDMVEGSSMEKSLHKDPDSLSKRQHQRNSKRKDSHGSRQMKQGRWESEGAVKDLRPSSLNDKGFDGNKQQAKAVSQSGQGSSGRNEKKTASLVDTKLVSGKGSSGPGDDARNVSAETTGKTVRWEEGSARLRNKDRPTMALYQPGQKSSVFQCQDGKEPHGKSKDQRTNPRNAEVKPACPSETTKTGSGRRDEERDSKDFGGACAKSREKGKGGRQDEQLKEERNQRYRQGSKGKDKKI